MNKRYYVIQDDPTAVLGVLKYLEDAVMVARGYRGTAKIYMASEAETVETEKDVVVLSLDEDLFWQRYMENNLLRSSWFEKKRKLEARVTELCEKLKTVEW